MRLSSLSASAALIAAIVGAASITVGSSGAEAKRDRVQDHRDTTANGSNRPQVQDHRPPKWGYGPKPCWRNCEGRAPVTQTPPPVIPKRNNCAGGVC